MFSLFSAKRRMRRVLRVVDMGVFSSGEIALHLDASEKKVTKSLDDLEHLGFLNSGTQVPCNLKIYRITRLGKESLATELGS